MRAGLANFGIVPLHSMRIWSCGHSSKRYAPDKSQIAGVGIRLIELRLIDSLLLAVVQARLLFGGCASKDRSSQFS